MKFPLGLKAKAPKYITSSALARERRLFAIEEKKDFFILNYVGVGL